MYRYRYGVGGDHIHTNLKGVQCNFPNSINSQENECKSLNPPTLWRIENRQDSRAREHHLLSTNILPLQTNITRLATQWFPLSSLHLYHFFTHIKEREREREKLVILLFLFVNFVAYLFDLMVSLIMWFFVDFQDSAPRFFIDFSFYCYYLLLLQEKNIFAFYC